MNKIRPSIAALMPVRNASRFLGSSLGSISSNDEFLDEIIIIDDGSTDASPIVLNEWARLNPKVRLLKTSGVGLVAALNLGMEIVQSEFVARFDADDIYHPRRLEIQSSALKPGVVAVFSDYTIFSESGRSLGFIPSPIFPDETAVSLVRSQRTPHPSVVFSVDAARAVGGYRTEDFPAEDLSLWLRLSRAGFLVTIPEFLLNYRISKSSISTMHSTAMFKKRLQLIEAIGLNPSAVSNCFQMLDSATNRYDKESHSEIRLLLHLIELKAALQTSGLVGGSAGVVKSLVKECLRPSSFKNTASFALQTINRKILKNFL